MLELKGIKKSYKVGEVEQKVLKGIDIKFRENEFVSILGQSGSGKTTLLNLIGGLDQYDDGDLIIDGVSTKEYEDRDWDSYRNYRVGFIFQSYNLIMHQSVLQNVEIALTLSGVSKSARKKKAIEVLKKVGLKDHIYKKPNQLSGGQMQRVAIARALVNDPEIILADEPTGALDTKTSVQIMDLLKEIASDKLVIMVTHNPDIAKEYSTRIVELRDGVIIDDSNPYTEKEKEVKERVMKKTSMSLFSALSLSFNNLLTKKGRTFLTAFAGSIGIIGIALILSLSNGVNNYAKRLERDSLSDFPITIERTSYDLLGSISVILANTEKVECEEGKICSKDDVVKNSIMNEEKGLLQHSDTATFKKYIESHEEFKNNADYIMYSYNLTLQVYTKDYEKVNPSNLSDVETETNIFKELNYNTDKYEVLAGSLPKNYDEIVLVVADDNSVNDSILYSLGIKDRKDLNADITKIRKDNTYKVKSKKYSYEDMLNKTYKLILNTDYYKEENGAFIDYSNNGNYLKNKINNGMDLKIVGIVKEKDNTESYVGYEHELVLHVVEEINKTDIFKKQMSNKEVDVLTGEEFDGYISTLEGVQEKLGLYEIDEPSSISIYPKNYEAKQELVKLIDKYNEENKNHKVTYTDVMKTLVNGVTKVINIISAVLIAFVAISLIVSSIMIAIITYISVLERTKEIGILRAIGASKRDIKRVFIAETIIEGLIAGCLGVGVALLLSLAINGVAGAFDKEIGSIAAMPLNGAIFLILLSVLLNCLAGSSPASMAAKKDPVEALRTE